MSDAFVSKTTTIRGVRILIRLIATFVCLVLLLPTVVKAQSLADVINSLRSGMPNVVTLDTLFDRDGIAYPKFSDTPFTGVTSGKLQIEILDGKINGPVKIFNDEGDLRCRGLFSKKYSLGVIKKKFIDDISFVGNLCLSDSKLDFREGFWDFYSSGRKNIRGEFINGFQEGRWDYYWASGKTLGHEFFEKGVLNGPTVTYHENGKLAYKGEYKNDLKEGRWEYYDEDGTRRLVPKKDVIGRVEDEGSGVYKDDKKISD